MMYSRIYIIVLFSAFVFASVLAGEDELIINPKLEGGLGAFPIGGSKVVSGDTVEAGNAGDTTVKHLNFRKMFPNGVKPADLLIRGKVPYPARRWVVAMTRSEEEFKTSFTQYKELVSEGKGREACRALHLARNIAVGMKVIRKDGSGNAENVPGKVGNFFLQVSILELEKYGGYLTFLSYEPSPEEDVVICAQNLENSSVHGTLLIEKVEDNDPKLVDYRMKILKAEITESYRPGKLNQVMKSD